MSDVPEGYKMSEVGVIPEEWEVKQFGDFAYLSKNYINPQHSKKSYPCIELEHLTQETGLLLGFVESKEQLSQKLIFSRGDVLFGKLRPYLKKFYFAEFDGACTSEIWVIKPHNNVIGPFIFHLIQSNRFLETANQTSGTKMPRADWKIVSCTPFPLPPLPEQQAIASALNDVDALITALEQLITKKRNIKQGAMQQLLTGKKRLPGFSGAWEVKKLGEIAEIATGNTPPTNDLNNYGNEFLFVSPADLGRSKYIIDSDKKLSKKGFNISRQFPKNSILFTCIGSTIGKSGIAPIVLTSNQQINAIFPNDSYSTDYVFYTLNHLAYRIKSLASEQAVPIINKSTFEATQTPFPPLPEQQAIAQILSDMDTEIESLEQKRDKYKAIKQGMMQELLTGERRLA